MCHKTDPEDTLWLLFLTALMRWMLVFFFIGWPQRCSLTGPAHHVQAPLDCDHVWLPAGSAERKKRRRRRKGEKKARRGNLVLGNVALCICETESRGCQEKTEGIELKVRIASSDYTEPTLQSGVVDEQERRWTVCACAYEYAKCTQQFSFFFFHLRLQFAYLFLWRLCSAESLLLHNCFCCSLLSRGGRYLGPQHRSLEQAQSASGSADSDLALHPCLRGWAAVRSNMC